MEWDKFWSLNKKKYEQTAHRYMGVFQEGSVELHIDGAPQGDIVAIPVALHPKVGSPSVLTRESVGLPAPSRECVYDAQIDRSLSDTLYRKPCRRTIG